MKSFLVLNLCILLTICLQGQDEEYKIKELKFHKGPVNSVAFSPDCQFIVSGSEDKTLVITNFKTWEAEHTYQNYFPPRAILVTKENKIFIGAGPDIKLIDFNNNNLSVYKGNTTHIWSIDYGPERDIIAAGSFDYKIKVWDVTTQAVKLTLEGHTKSTLPVAISPDEKYFVSGSLDKSIKIWNAQTGEMLKSLERHSDNIYDIEFHPTGMYFVSCSRDKTIRLWDFKTGDVLVTFVGHDKAVMDIEFSPDGNHLLSASLDGTIRLWEAKTGKMVYTFTGHENGVNCIALSSDGKYLASGGNDNKVKIWELNRKIFVEFAYFDEFEAEKSKTSLFHAKRQDENKQDYEKRMAKAKELEDQIVDNFYKKYLVELNNKSFKLESK
jgi:WD40 repeat protein